MLKYYNVNVINGQFKNNLYADVANFQKQQNHLNTPVVQFISQLQVTVYTKIVGSSDTPTQIFLGVWTPTTHTLAAPLVTRDMMIASGAAKQHPVSK